MGLFDGKSYSTSDVNGFLNIGSSSSQHRSSSRNRGVSPARSAHSTGGGTGYYVRHNNNNHGSSRPGHGYYARSTSSRGIFAGGGSGSSSYYRRRPRDGYLSYLMHKLQRMLRELWYYARRHPVKAFFALVVPLLSAGGAIHGLLRQVGVRVPFGLDAVVGRYSGGGGYYGSRGYEGGGGGGWMENAGGLVQMAKLFM